MNWQVYKIPALCLAGGIAGGVVIAKYTLPPRVEERERVVVKEVEKITFRDREVKVEGPVRETTRTVTVPGPQGPTVTVEKIVEKEVVVTKIVHDQASSTTTDTDTEKSKITDARSWFAAEGQVGLATGGRWAGSGAATIRLIGPLWAGGGVIKADTWYFGPAVRIEF